MAHTERPDTPTNLEIVEAHSRSVKLSWRRPFDGNSPVLSYLVQYQPLRGVHSAYNSIPSSSSSSGPSSTVSVGTADSAADAVGGFGVSGIVGGDEWKSPTTINVTLPTISGIKR